MRSRGATGAAGSLPAVTESPAGKGRPTPKRRDSEKRRGGPVAPPPQTRKEAAQRLREQAKADRARVRQGMKAGDESNLLPRDRGPARALIRDVIDARRNFGLLLLPAALLPFVAQQFDNPQVVSLSTTLYFVLIMFAFGDLALAGFLVRRVLRERMPEEKGRGHVLYGLMRSFQFRRFRLPPPRVSPGRRA